MRVPLLRLIIGFAIIGLQGFGGVLPWVRRSVVEQHHWITPDEFNTLLGLCQIMPGPNVVNLGICIGYKLRGLWGAVACTLGLIVPPMILIIACAYIYRHYAGLPEISGTLAGISAVGIGLIAATGLKMLREVFKVPRMLIVVTTLFLGVALFKFSMMPVVFIGFILALLLARPSKKELPDKKGVDS